MPEPKVRTKRGQSKDRIFREMEPTGQKLNLSPFNEKLFSAICLHAAKHHYLDPLGRIACVLSLEKVTLHRRFDCDRLWNIHELRMIRRETNDPRIVDAIVEYMNEEPDEKEG